MNRAVPRRYAKALLMLALEKDALDQYEKELELFARFLRSDPGIKQTMDNPKVPPQDKKKILELGIPKGTSAIVSNFLHLIVDKRRESVFLEIINEYKNYADEARNIVDAEVRSAVALTDKDYRALEQKLLKATGRRVRLKNTIDTSLIGGIVVKVGDTIIDGSVVKKLALLKNRLQKSQFEGIGVIK